MSFTNSVAPLTTTTDEPPRTSVPKTSISHPINISWVLPNDYLPLITYCELPKTMDIYDLTTTMTTSMESSPLLLTTTQTSATTTAATTTTTTTATTTTAKDRPIMGNLALSSCPGKKVRLSGPVRGRAAINRDLDLDFTRMRSFGITTLVCCLEDTELEYLGASWSMYASSAHANGLQVLRLPMIEGSCPNDMEEIDRVMAVVNNKIWNGENVLTHCRGGVGRAGLFACCWLIHNTLCLTAERAIRFVRVRRSPKAIETMRQAEFVIRYAHHIRNGGGGGGGGGIGPLMLTHTDLTLSVPSVLDIGHLEESLRPS